MKRVPYLLFAIVALVATDGALVGSSAVEAQVDAPYELAEVNGLSLAYRDVGEGDPLLLLHGFSNTGALWDPMLEAYASEYRVIVPDLRGHGRSTNPDGTFTHRQAARDVFALLDRLGIARVRAMGSSTGAMTLLHMATEQPRRIDAMVLLSGTTYFPDQAREIMRDVKPEEASDESLEERARRQGHVRGAEQVRELMSQFRDFQHSYDDMNFTPPYLGTIEASTLIIHGDRDAFFPVSIPVEAYEAIPKSYLWIVPNAGHGALRNSERGRERLIETTLEFFSGTWERSGS